MRVLVTGGAGYIGSVTTRMTAAAGHDVLVLDDLSKGHDAALLGAPLEIADLRDRRAVRAACEKFMPDVCMHFAAVSLVGESVKQPARYFGVNVAGGVNLLEALLECGCKAFVFSSTAAVYGEPQSVPIEEGVATRPVNPYGHTKLAFERILSECSKAGDFSYISLRYFNAAGADVEGGLGEDHLPETHLVPLVVKAAFGLSPYVSVFGNDYPTPDGTCVRDYIHVSDLAGAHLLALQYLVDGGASGVYNLGNGDGFSVRQVIESVKRVSGRDFEVVEAARRPGDPPSLVASSRRISDVLGWKPAYTGLDSIVETACAWHSAHPRGYSPSP
jgi:UDP-glucose-4-epimerase GalE